jgi:hypothetical protein
MIIATLVGVILFITDLVFGWMTIVTGRIPVIWVIAIVIGFIAGSAMRAVQSTLLAWVIGLLLGTVLAPFVFAEFWDPESTFLLMPLALAMWSLRGTFAFEYEGSWIGGIAFAAGALLVMLAGTPMLYLMSLGVGAIGGYMGQVLRKRLEQRQEDHYTAPHEADISEQDTA